MRKAILTAAMVATFGLGGQAFGAPPEATIAAPAAPTLPADLAEFRGLYKELVETNTTLSSGSCTRAAERMAFRLRAAGMTDRQLTIFWTEGHPRDGGLVATFPGTSKRAKPILLLGHLDVVEARRADWTRDPFTLVEENGYFYARGSYDDKAMSAIWVDTLVRFTRDGYKPRRTIKLALTCGEETAGAFNGAEWLAKNRRSLIDADFALNEGGGGRTDGNGRLLTQGLQVGEKAFQNFRITATNPGGHSSQPVRANAIYELADALVKLREHEFPLQMTDTTRAFFARAGAARGDDALGRAMVALSANPADAAAETVVNRDKAFHSMLRTTCVATVIEGGHATNALPQRASANINCRMFPGRSPQETQAALVTAIGNPAIAVDILPPIRPVAVPQSLDPRIIGPVERLAARHFPGVPVIPTMLTGATDGIFLQAVGIPVYGVPGLWSDPDGNGTHGLNERIEVRALYAARAYLYDLVKAYADKN